MRKLLALILILGGMYANGQSITPVNGDYQYNGNVYFAKGLFIPVLDTVAGYLYRVGAERIRPADTVGHPLTVPVYVWTGRRWMNAVGSGGSSYTAGNGLSLSGSEFRLGGSLSVGGTEIVTGSNTFGLNTGIHNASTLFIGNGISKIGNYEPNGSFAGYFYVPDYGRGKNQFWMKGQPVLSYDYTGLQLSDTAGSPIANINTAGSLRLKQPNGNYYLDAGINKFLTMSTGDTVLYADDTRAQFRALANVDPLKVLSTDAFGAIQLVTSPSANTIYTSNGTIPDERTITGATSNGIHWNSFNAVEFNEDDGAGSVASYGFYPYGFAWGWTPVGGEPTSEFNYSSSILSLSLSTSGQYKVTKTEDAQLGAENTAFEKQTGAITNNERIEFHQGFDSDSSIFTIRKYKTNWTGSPGKLFDIDSFGTVKMQRYRNNSTKDSVLSVNQFGKLELKYLSTATWDSTKIKDSTIHNQNWASQAANFSITGQASAPIYNAYNATGIPFTSYYNFSHDGIDTSKKTWSIGLQGTATAPLSNGGDSLKFRSYTTTGAVLSDLMTLSRTGAIYIPGQLTLGVVNGSTQKLLVNGGSVFTKDITVSGVVSKSYLRETNIVTVTGDYTVLQTDLYVNVNNSTNCTITLPLSNSSVFHIKKISNNGATVTIVGPNGTELIDGSTSYVMSAFNDHANIHQNDATNYFIY